MQPILAWPFSLRLVIPSFALLSLSLLHGRWDLGFLRIWSHLCAGLIMGFETSRLPIARSNMTSTSTVLGAATSPSTKYKRSLLLPSVDHSYSSQCAYILLCHRPQ
ncbi:hypothetical protein BU24DRAFT_416895 [Aaosphaeria arxii CBS 175.79]|uniref:Uncharacterized protein n=1 Tax=Aaosphaeria arxii CBS 175.79 TaxID=1450172 RepID=A0A6A5Y7G6_9PLEO|nr:uncharacterized protein BU24DRAFT_416895 [Aaosphaeria arxii CBS 175.79]KAF2021239.1 hypothetical protein BU24DRAFT_416895 [Aaosphaeria arxii CBS 175.79]